MEIIFSVGCADKIAILHHPDGNLSNNADIDALYDEIGSDCPVIKKHELMNGVYRADFSAGADSLNDIEILVQREWHTVKTQRIWGGR
jgi:hypothetical protein